MQSGDNLHLLNIKHFDLDETLDCGQAFRYEKTETGYMGVAHNRHIELAYEGDNLVLKNVSANEFESIWKNYFDLGRNYGNLRAFLSEHGGEPMKLATGHSPGLRHMFQDPWEMLVSFILSQNTNIPRIKSMIRRLCENFGEKLPCGGLAGLQSEHHGLKTCPPKYPGHAFPTCHRLAQLNADALGIIKCGYRAEYILDAARRTADGKFNPCELKNKETAEIRHELLRIHGVGPKVADCVLLLGFGRIEVCPVDVWIKRAMAEFYPKGFPDKLLPYAGIAQQFLFHYVRNRIRPEGHKGGIS